MSWPIAVRSGRVVTQTKSGKGSSLHASSICIPYVSQIKTPCYRWWSKMRKRQAGFALGALRWACSCSGAAGPGHSERSGGLGTGQEVPPIDSLHYWGEGRERKKRKEIHSVKDFEFPAVQGKNMHGERRRRPCGRIGPEPSPRAAHSCPTQMKCSGVPLTNEGLRYPYGCWRSMPRLWNASIGVEVPLVLDEQTPQAPGGESSSRRPSRRKESAFIKLLAGWRVRMPSKKKGTVGDCIFSAGFHGYRIDSTSGQRMEESGTAAQIGNAGLDQQGGFEIRRITDAK